MVPLTNSPQISVLKNNIGSPLLTLPVYSKSVGGSETLQEGPRMREQPWSGVLLGDQQHLVLKASSQKWHMTLVLRCHWWSPAPPNVKWGGGGRCSPATCAGGEEWAEMYMSGSGDHRVCPHSGGYLFLFPFSLRILWPYPEWCFSGWFWYP